MAIARLSTVAIIAARHSADPVLERLDPPRRAAVVMALLALVLTGLLLVTCVMLGAHWVRRLARQKPSGGSGIASDATAKNRQLRESLGGFLPHGTTDDTMLGDVSTKETRVEPQG